MARTAVSASDAIWSSRASIEASRSLTAVMSALLGKLSVVRYVAIASLIFCCIRSERFIAVLTLPLN